MNKSQKITGQIVQYGNSYNIVGSVDEDINSEASKRHLSKAQIEAEKLIQKALMQVDETINQAQQEANDILEQAKEDAVKIQAQAQETGQKMGYDAGYEAGYNQSIGEASSIIASAETIVKGAYQSQKEILLSTEREMLNLVLAISKKVINRAFNNQPEIILRLIDITIRELKEHEEVKLIINPKNVELIKKASDLLKNQINGLHAIKIIEDKSIPITGVIVESSSGKIDAQIESQLEEIYNKLLDEAAKNPANIPIKQQNPIQQPVTQKPQQQAPQQNIDNPKNIPSQNLKNILDNQQR